MATAQEVFDKVVAHLRKQGERAVEVKEFTSHCKYRLEKDDQVLKCAVGCLIEDDEYDTRLEGEGVTEILEKFQMPKFQKEYGEHMRLLSELQYIHDSRSYSPSIDHWETRFQALARKLNLVYTEKEKNPDDK